MGGMKGLDYEYGYNKPIELNETLYYPFQYQERDPILDFAWKPGSSSWAGERASTI